MQATSNDKGSLSPNGSPSPRPVRWIVPGALAVVGIAAAALAACNVYIAQHRSLHVVNGFGVPVAVCLDGGSPIEVQPNDRVTLVVAEGPHEARVTAAGGRVLTAGPFTVSASLLARFFKQPLYVLNAGCGATLIWEEVVYGKQGAPGGMRLSVGQPFVAFDDVDFAFVQLPKAVKIAGVPVRKTRVEVFPLSPEQIMTAPLNLVGVSDRLTLAEAHLQLNPSDPALLKAYLETSEQHSQGERARQFLAAQAIAPPGTRVR